MCGQPPSHDQTSGFYPHLTVICLHPNIKHPQVTFKILPTFHFIYIKKTRHIPGCKWDANSQST